MFGPMGCRRVIGGQGYTNPLPAFEAAQTDYTYNAGEPPYNGSIPSPAVAAATLGNVDVSNNELSGSLPNFDGLPVLTSWNSSGNAEISGSLSWSPTHPTLDAVNVGNCSHSGSIPQPPPQMGSLEGANNAFTDVVSFDDVDSLDYVDLTNNSLSQAAVNAILVGCAANATTDGYAGLTGNTAPGASGLAAKATLEGRGWTVDVDA